MFFMDKISTRNPSYFIRRSIETASGTSLFLQLKKIGRRCIPRFLRPLTKESAHAQCRWEGTYLYGLEYLAGGIQFF